MYYAEVEEMGEKIRKGEDIRCVMSVDDGDAHTKKSCDRFQKKKKSEKGAHVSRKSSVVLVISSWGREQKFRRWISCFIFISPSTRNKNEEKEKDFYKNECKKRSKKRQITSKRDDDR